MVEKLVVLMVWAAMATASAAGLLKVGDAMIESLDGIGRGERQRQAEIRKVQCDAQLHDDDLRCAEIDAWVDHPKIGEMVGSEEIDAGSNG